MAVFIGNGKNTKIPIKITLPAYEQAVATACRSNAALLAKKLERSRFS